MSRLYTIALGLVLCAGATMAVSAQTGSTGERSDTTAVTGRRDRGQMRSRMRVAMERADRALFRGIDLTSEQKVKIDSIRSTYRSESRSLREQMRADMKGARAARQSGDSAKIAEARESMAAWREKLASLRSQERGEIRSVLTPEQQTTFDRNVEEIESRMKEGRSGRRGARSWGRPGAIHH